MRTALLLIDIQRDYFPGGLYELKDVEAAGAKAATLLSHARGQGWSVFHVQHVSIRPGATFFLPGTTGIEIYPCVTPLPGEEIVVKHFPNSFRETALAGHLESMDIHNLVICGAMSHMCIDATTRRALDRGYTCAVAHDACATRDLEFGGQNIPAAHVHGAFMAALGHAGAQVMSVEELLKG